MRVIAIANQKGGSAKTTTAIHLAAGLGLAGRRVLLVDLDAQGHVAEGLGIPPAYPHEIDEVLARKIVPSEAVLVDVRAGMDVIPATIRLSYLETELTNARFRREDRLKLALATLADRYDYTILDCPPSLGIFTINALAAANEVLIPMAAEYFAKLGVELLLRTISDVQDELNAEIRVLGILPTRVGRTTNAREIVEIAHEQYEDTHRVFDLTIPETVKFREAAGLGRTIFEHAPETPGARAYHGLVKEVDLYDRS